MCGAGGGVKERGREGWFRSADASHHSVVCNDETEIEIEKANCFTRASLKVYHALVSDDVTREGTKKIYKGLKKDPEID